MPNNPLVSIVLPVFNGEKYLEKSIQSVINQTYSNWELIIVDDCSTDKSNEIAQNFASIDNRIKVYKNEKNIKLPASLNAGFKRATGEYFTWTSDDNEYYPCAIEKMVNYLNANSAMGMVYAICDMVDENDKKLCFWGNDCPSARMLLEYCISGACFLYRKTVADSVGEYDEKTFLAEDHDFWLRIKLKYEIGHIEEILYKYRIHKNSLNSQNTAKARLLGIDLTIKYSKIYLEKFPYLKNFVENEIKLWETLRNKNSKELQIIKQTVKRKILYLELKKFYLLDRDDFYLKEMAKLGLKYFIKALCLKFKKGK